MSNALIGFKKIENLSASNKTPDDEVDSPQEMEVNNTVANGEVDSPQEMEINYTGSSSSKTLKINSLMITKKKI